MIDWLTFSRPQNSPYFCEFKHARAVKSEARLKTESETGERQACEACAPRASESQAKPILRKKKLTVLQSRLFLTYESHLFCSFTLTLCSCVRASSPGRGFLAVPRSAGLLMTHACALRLKSTWRQRYKVILQVTLFLYLLREVYLTDMQRILMNFAQTFFSTSSTMKFLFAISLMSVCLFLVTARFVHFIHRQEIVEDLNARDDPGVTGLFDMPSRSSSKIHIASCGLWGMPCIKNSQCCSHHCTIPMCNL